MRGRGVPLLVNDRTNPSPRSGHYAWVFGPGRFLLTLPLATELRTHFGGVATLEGLLAPQPTLTHEFSEAALH